MNAEAPLLKKTQMAQLSMFEEVPNKQTWSDMVLSVSSDQDKILRDIMVLHNGGLPFELDPTYSKGVFYKNLPKPRYKFDLTPQSDEVQQADACDLPFEDGTIQSIMFDPPFLASHSNVDTGKIKKRFTSFKSIDALWEFYDEALQEFYRILAPGGLLVFKCQDTVSGGKNYFSHYVVEEYARRIGFVEVDLFILHSKTVMWSANMSRQCHARKTHSFVLCFRKPKEKKR